jgi:O-antigen ligase
VREALASFFAPVLARRGLERIAFAFFLLGVGAVPSIAVANIALAVCGAATIAWRLLAARRGEDALAPFRRPSPLNGPIGALVVLTAASAVFSTLPSRSLPELKGLGTFGLAIFTVALLSKREDIALLLSLWRVTTLYLVVRGVLQWAAGANSTGLRITGGLSVYMTYAGLLMCFALLFASLAALGVSLSLTRSAYVGLAVGLALILATAHARLLLALPVAVLAAALLVPAAVKARALSSFDPNDPTMRDRILMWRAGAAMVADRPLFGLGPKRVKDLYPVYRRPGWVLPNPGHLHSNAVTIAAETGIPSLLAYLAFVGAFFVGAVRRLRGADPFDAAVVRGSLAVMAALFTSGLFEMNFGDVEVLMATLVIASLPFALPSARIQTHGLP